MYGFLAFVASKDNAINAIYDWIDKKQRFDTAFKAMTNSVKNVWKQMLADMAAKLTTFLALKAIAKLISLIPGGEGVGSIIGGIAEGYKPFQKGGIATQPTMGLVAEYEPEAIIPLRRLQEFAAGLTDLSDIIPNMLQKVKPDLGITQTEKIINVNIEWKPSLEGAIISDMDEFYEKIVMPSENIFKQRIVEAVSKA